MADDMERVIASGKKAFSSAETKIEGGNTNSWETMLNDGCADPYTNTAASLKARNGRNGSQAGA